MFPSSAAARVHPVATPAHRTPAHRTPAHCTPARQARVALTVFAALIAAAPSAAAQGGTAPDSTALVTRLGKDTLAVEHVVRAGNVIEADVLLRTPSTTRTRDRMELAADGTVQR